MASAFELHLLVACRAHGHVQQRESLSAGGRAELQLYANRSRAVCLRMIDVLCSA
jgi:hypothetical protein